MKKQLIYLLASACLLAAGCSTENKTDETGYGTLAINCTADTSIDTVNADLTATVANSQVVIRATEQFLAYFHDARFTVTTASGNEFAFTPGSDPADEPVFVKGGTRLTVTGTARRQSPTGTGEGPEVTFSAQTLDATTPRTCHIITYDAKNAGSATLTITLGDSYTDTRTLDCEVNEGAIDDTEKK